MRLITNRFPARCKQCKALVPADAQVWWERGFGVICDPCFAKPADPKTGEALEDPDTWGVQADIDAQVAEEEKRANDLARRYGPVGRFNRQVAQRIIDADPLPVHLGPDALVAEIDALSDLYSNYFDVTPGEARDASGERYYARVKRALDDLNAELERRALVGAKEAPPAK